MLKQSVVRNRGITTNISAVKLQVAQTWSLSFFQAYCPSHTGRSEPSFGRRRREVNSTLGLETNNTAEAKTDEAPETSEKKSEDKAGAVYKVSYEEATVDKYLKDEVETPSHVRKMIEVRTQNRRSYLNY